VGVTLDESKGFKCGDAVGICCADSESPTADGAGECDTSKCSCPTRSSPAAFLSNCRAVATVELAEYGTGTKLALDRSRIGSAFVEGKTDGEALEALAIVLEADGTEGLP